MPSIRPYHPSDDEAMIHIFRETAYPDLYNAGDPALHYASFNWLRPYTVLAPSQVLILDDDGKAVGYLLSTSDTAAFVAQYHATFIPYLKDQGIIDPSVAQTPEDQAEGDIALSMRRLAYKPDSMLHASTPSLLREYPAHLHINMLPAYQRQGWGRKMIEATLTRFQEEGVPGIHLGKAGTNVEAGKFYARLGFERFGEVMDGGGSGEVGRAEDGGICLVKKL